MPKKEQQLPLEQQLLVNKRLSLNLLIQGSATHAFLSAHHLAAEALNELNPEFLNHYDQLMVCVNLGYWVGMVPMISGNPRKYFRRLDRPSSPFKRHRFMLEYGEQLADESRQFIVDKAAEFQLEPMGLKVDARNWTLSIQTLNMEEGHECRLQQIGKQVCNEIYGIPTDRLHAELTPNPAFGNVRTPRTISGKLLKSSMAGWSAVERRNGRLEVIAKAVIWPLLVHELIKGTVELICLHGLSSLTDEEFDVVMDRTDHVEYEIPMLQIGGAFFRKFLNVLPRHIGLAECIMHVSRMPPLVLEEFLCEMMKDPNSARGRIEAAASSDLS